jgi:hypothetical protein
MNTVVNIKTGKPYDLYIGRENRSYGLKASKWANPYIIGKYTRDESCDLYIKYVREGPLWNDLEELEGLVLACWCNTIERCHGKELIKLLAEKKYNEIS